MKMIRSIIGYAIAPIYVFTVWGAFVNDLGVIGGWIAGFAIIGPLWFIMHYSNIIPQSTKAAFVDIGLAIGVGGIAQGVFSGLGVQGLIEALPTILILSLGAIVGGYAASTVSKSIKEELQ